MTIHVFQEGGIGDLILSMPFIEHILKQDKISVKLYTVFPEIAHYFMPWINVDGDLYKANSEKKNWDYFISITDMIFFTKRNDVILPEFLQPLYKAWLNHFEEWHPYLKPHPLKANEMAHKALSMGLKRWTLPFHFADREYQQYTLIPKVKDIHIPQHYITIHDGFDATNHYKYLRSNKSWDIEYWAKFVKLFKDKYPDIAVVQLGGVKHQKIKGVDLNFAGQLGFEKTLEYLKSSLVHIDGDSGLVHARRLFNKPSIVLFGATNPNYFGYPENINIAPSFCGDCWWKNRDWMQNCMEGHSTPKCLDSITPDMVMISIDDILPKN